MMASSLECLTSDLGLRRLHAGGAMTDSYRRPRDTLLSLNFLPPSRRKEMKKRSGREPLVAA